MSALERRIPQGEIQVVRQAFRIQWQIVGQEYLSDEELLRWAILKEHELERTMRELQLISSELERGTSEFVQERAEA